jgi:hypothetical protein
MWSSPSTSSDAARRTGTSLNVKVEMPGEDGELLVKDYKQLPGQSAAARAYGREGGCRPNTGGSAMGMLKTGRAAKGMAKQGDAKNGAGGQGDGDGQNGQGDQGDAKHGGTGARAEGAANWQLADRRHGEPAGLPSRLPAGNGGGSCSEQKKTPRPDLAFGLQGGAACCSLRAFLKTEGLVLSFEGGGRSRSPASEVMRTEAQI